jgi:molybdopterin molybdotransferase
VANTLLEVADFIAAGDAKETAVPGPASCVEIMTGARVPTGFDSIVRIEDTTPHGSSERARFIRLLKAMEAGENLRNAGEDYEVGDRILARNERVQAAHIMA